MAIRTEQDPMGMGGDAWYVASPSELGELPGKAAALVPARVRSIFSDVPGALDQMAGDAPLESMRRWLASLKDATCTLEVYATKHFGSEARLRFLFPDDFSPSFRAVAATPAIAVPQLLRDVHALTGHIDTQYGCSGTLVALDEVATLETLVREQRVLGSAEIAEILEGRPELASWIGFFEADGDWLLCGPDGRTAWAGLEWMSGLEESSLDLRGALDALFTALGERRYFRP